MNNKNLRNPFPTVDIIINTPKGIVLVFRKNDPKGWALPGGFVDYGETVEQAAIREAKEETDLDITLVKQFHVYSDPKRDPRFHVMTTVFIAKANGEPIGKDDAAVAKIFTRQQLEKAIKGIHSDMCLVFDHSEILKDYFEVKY